MSCCLKKYATKTVVLTPQRPQGAITPLTPLTSELAKLELYFYNINGGAPDGKPLMTKEGKGKVKCIRFLNTKYSGGGMASTLDYNAND